MTPPKSTTEQLLSLGLLLWYPFEMGSRVLFMGPDSDVWEQALSEKGLDVYVCSSIEETSLEEKYKYIILISEIEKQKSPLDYLLQVKGHLDANGHLFVAMENRMGLRYFCGDRDPYTGRIFDGIEGYKRYLKEDWAAFSGHLYGKGEMEALLEEAGFTARKYYSILPGLEMPQQMYAQGCYPNEELSVRYSPIYHTPQTVFLNEGMLHNDLIKNGLFHEMANAYLFDISNEPMDDISSITTSLDRGKERALATLIHGEDFVEKKAIFKEGKASIENLWNNTTELSNRGLKVVQLEKNETGDGVTMPFIKAETAVEYLRNLFYSDLDKFISEIDDFVELIKKSGEETDNTDALSGKNAELGKIYQHAFIDLVPLNCFRVDDEFVFYDQEFVREDTAVNSIIIRALDIIYAGDKSMNQIYPEDNFLVRYGLKAKESLLRVIGNEFISDLRNTKDLEEYRKKYWADGSIVNANRQRMNYSQAEINRLYGFPMNDTEGKEIYIFGTGAWAIKFLNKFEGYCAIAGALDNSENKIGQDFKGIKISNPEILKEMDPDSYKVIICIKNLSMIVNQLQNLGVKNFSAFDPDIDWPELEDFYRSKEDELRELHKADSIAHQFDDEIGHYKKGYVAGVFDLFHMGHLNILRRAKEHCDYLLVGVVSDEQAGSGKAHSPYVNEKERLEIVKACKYVDEAFILPIGAAGTQDIYMKYHFDAQFSGSDYENDPSWLSQQSWLRERGSDLVFFSYTDSVSSTKLKEKLEEQKNNRR